jgi:hypothetical protein
MAGERKLARPSAGSKSSAARAARLTWAGLSTKVRASVVVSGLVMVAGVSLLYGIPDWPHRRPVLPVNEESTYVAVDPWANDSLDPKESLRSANPITHYFGIPLSGKTIGYVVDGDATMAPYIDNVAALTNSVNEAIEKGTRRFGVMLAIERDGKTVVEAAEPSTDLEGARAVLTGQLASGRTDLGKALSVASNWYADEIFLVLSKPVDQDQMAVLTQRAEQTSAVVHVIALGPAAKQDLSQMAKATGGMYVSVSDDELTQLVERQNEAKSRG